MREDDKNQYVTKSEMEDMLAKQSNVIISAVESIVEKKVEKSKNELISDINNVQTLIDGHVKAQEDFNKNSLL